MMSAMFGIETRAGNNRFNPFGVGVRGWALASQGSPAAVSLRFVSQVTTFQIEHCTPKQHGGATLGLVICWA